MHKLSIANIKLLFDNNEIDEQSLQQLSNDTRKGVQTLVARYNRQREKELKAREQFFKLVAFDKKFQSENIQYVAGVDEAGRGPLAGPVVAAAVILPEDFTLIGLNDSKQITAEQRDKMYDYIIQEAISYEVAVVSNEQIDALNIYDATKLAMTEAVKKLAVPAQFVLTDAMPLNDGQIPYESIVKGDEKSLAIAAASILAKVTRDRWMVKLDEQYPQYDFKGHKGYGTKAHLEALQQYGLTPYHRLTFSPVKQFI